MFHNKCDGYKNKIKFFNCLIGTIKKNHNIHNHKRIITITKLNLITLDRKTITQPILYFLKCIPTCMLHNQFIG